MRALVKGKGAGIGAKGARVELEEEELRERRGARQGDIGLALGENLAAETHDERARDALALGLVKRERLRTIVRTIEAYG